jgi:NAD+ synthase
MKPAFHKDILELDAAATCEQIEKKLRDDVLRVLHRRGAVVGISGGIDSSVTLALAARALGAKRVLGVLMPEHDSSPESVDLAMELAGKYGVETVVEPMTPALEGFGCYRRRDEAVKRVFPEFDPAKDKFKIVLPQDILNQDTLSLFSITMVRPDGTEKTERLPPQEYLQIVAASNFKQRSRMAMLYFHAEERVYAVIGTPNKHEHDQGFFVKHGDGGTDAMPIEHLYKTQVYQLAAYLGVPEAIVKRPPTADTYSAPATQEEFFFQLPFAMLDLLWHGYENAYEAAEVAEALGLREEQVARVYRNFERKQRTTEYLRTPPVRGYAAVARVHTAVG